MNAYVNNELYHHGIKGQRWGVRRYQNPDGSYTPEGRNRRNKEDREVRKSRLNNSRHASRLSDKDLDEAITRLKKERELKNLTNELVRPGKARVEKLMSKIGSSVLDAAIIGAITYAGKKYVESLSNPNSSTKLIGTEDYEELARYMFPNPNKKK